MNSSLTLYEKMSEISARMAEAAQANDWDQLGQLESQVAAMRNELMTRDWQAPRTNAVLSEDERRRKAELIKRILADDREVRRHTEPWMEDVRKLLGGNSRGRAMRVAYGAIAD
ncbi:flagellar protein FliT [Niveibacterium sp. SC-1]|uniref:flagellar protein FliT n=1 Tax=Niveibacterium sp. SC-1 TaxID=3135646 RepID=UPI00311D3570